MPTENRSSNTDPRDVFIRLNPLGLGEAELRKDSTGFEDQRTHSDYLLFLAGYRESHPEPLQHPEPIAWMVGTAFWWTKEKAERDAAATGLSIVPVGPLISIPDGYCLMPKRLTAENGAKSLLLGEFKLEVTQECPECRELDEPVEGCDICDGEGEFGQRHIIPWDKIKHIYSEAVRGLAIHPGQTREPA
ncbi:hypothetical protein KKQ11_13415 [Pseudomonas sp. MG-2]|uniref:hypothetical protein n=1 Tax=Pseudomonas sp. MG-2 TaxID=405714 RepID=UPI001BFFFF68|nr:hypothetical protein [Pseudomonas sp. MG-2]MBT9236835.1 hypothetical protein [Pseudomonas sp. MG-2]